jgi:stage II sporulation protein D
LSGRRRLACLLVPLVLAGPGAAASSPAAQGAASLPSAAAPGRTVFVLTGGGYGHGVGLSQWGARAQAQAGRSYREILAFYYPGTEPGRAARRSLRVLIAESRTEVAVSSLSAFSLRDGAGRELLLPPGGIDLRPDLEVDVGGVPVRLASPLELRPGRGGALALDGVPYRGRLRLLAGEGRLTAVNVLGLEEYVLGAVSGEMPATWPLEALKAQAVAVRSYALAALERGKPYDLYGDRRSQAYAGRGAETPAAAAAVRATAGEVLLHAGTVATTFFHASSGGRTASAADVFGVDVPYLRSLADRWDRGSPDHVWEPRTLDPAQLGQAFGLRSPVADAAVLPTASGRAAAVRLTTSAGTVLEVSPADFRERLGLRSTGFRIGVLRLGRVAAPVPPDAPLELAGLARGFREVVLETRAGGGWVPAGRPRLRPDGTFTAVVRPSVTSRYRLAAGGLAGAVLTVRVAAGAA